MRCAPVVMIVVSLSLALAPQLSAQAKPSVAQFLSPAYPSTLVTAKKADRIAWVAYERGMRNVYTATSPDFIPVRLTNFLKDDGIEINTLSLSDDGSTALFVRGTAVVTSPSPSKLGSSVPLAR